MQAMLGPTSTAPAVGAVVARAFAAMITCARRRPGGFKRQRAASPLSCHSLHFATIVCNSSRLHAKCSTSNRSPGQCLLVILVQPRAPHRRTTSSTATPTSRRPCADDHPRPPMPIGLLQLQHVDLLDVQPLGRHLEDGRHVVRRQEDELRLAAVRVRLHRLLQHCRAQTEQTRGHRQQQVA